MPREGCLRRARPDGVRLVMFFKIDDVLRRQECFDCIFLLIELIHI